MNRSIIPSFPPPPPDLPPRPSTPATGRGYGCVGGYLLLTAICLLIGGMARTHCPTFFGLGFGSCAPAVAFIPALPWVGLAPMIGGLDEPAALFLSYLLNAGLCLRFGRRRR